MNGITKKIKDLRTWKGIKLFFGALAKTVPTVLLVFSSCATKQGYSDFFESNRNSYVSVYLDGDVRYRGERQIRRELSRQNIIEAAGGIGDLSAAKPKTIKISRGSETFRVPFKDMGRGEWAEFLINEGDRIIVETLYF